MSLRRQAMCSSEHLLQAWLHPSHQQATFLMSQMRHSWTTSHISSLKCLQEGQTGGGDGDRSDDGGRDDQWKWTHLRLTDQWVPAVSAASVRMVMHAGMERVQVVGFDEIKMQVVVHLQWNQILLSGSNIGVSKWGGQRLAGSSNSTENPKVQFTTQCLEDVQGMGSPTRHAQTVAHRALKNYKNGSRSNMEHDVRRHSHPFTQYEPESITHLIESMNVVRVLNQPLKSASYKVYKGSSFRPFLEELNLQCLRDTLQQLSVTLSTE
ncbi:uncharacterized protein LAESUDRAFT_717343 [Laetiporus sulphureus 93-53]|uniref:Uncharacterized protein n=1 Tax=Laetiporus sulphureus 93-53 TaxID=1314785 RepID=A0A165BU83_9APHY|nr:uncharacterized protein LAESUDRAFT_717342 [Laetiporus sulphureus 93-53]XP_040759400.1 uncharacterized protein LAESUDRAFT_717343 [Laetiporus sulphureus 93-53]KZT01659.1 hypothetical protein LAESUDRAFT_717342 [Laetiporus sulphureus 93-53]KZT01660.1 hypothetical protein LAESUDRAFT_717343 [Laetiporus sulphureus 93-53]